MRETLQVASVKSLTESSPVLLLSSATELGIVSRNNSDALFRNTAISIIYLITTLWSVSSSSNLNVTTRMDVKYTTVQ